MRSPALPDSVAAAFEVRGQRLHSAPHGSGHIHASFLARYRQGERLTSYLYQRINRAIFADVPGLMDNVLRVTEHLRAALAEHGAADRERRCLTVIPTRAGRPFHREPDGSCWRCYRFIEGTRGFDEIRDARQAHEAARAFGEFAALLADLGPPPLAVTIPDFHDLASRFAALGAAARADRVGRAADAAPELDAAERHFERLERELSDAGADALPERVAHNDCKLNNLLFDERSGAALCVVDLDTVMNGSLLPDFGDLVRTAAATAAEDERDLSRVTFDLARFEALARGYRAGAGALLDARELRVLPLAGAVQTLENALRFLADHLAGDVYFRIHRAGHNRDRARAQLRLLERMLERLPETREAFERAGREPAPEDRAPRRA